MALLKRIIPCLDIDRGRVVKGRQFVDLQDLGDPVQLACRYEQEGADELVLLDITASHEGRNTALSIVRDVASQLSIPFTVGGGVRCIDDIHALLDAGADKVAINSAALKTPELIDQASAFFGSQCIVVAIDFRDSNHGDGVYAAGGRLRCRPSVVDWATEACHRGAGELLLTCINRDGSGIGFETGFTGMLANTLPVPVIASGGARNAHDFIAAFTAGADAALAAGIFHRRDIEISALKRQLHEAGIAIRKTC